MESTWRAAMRTRHYLTVGCLDAPCVAAWMALYRNGVDSNFLNATSLTRYVTDVRCVIGGGRSNYIPSRTTQSCIQALTAPVCALLLHPSSQKQRTAAKIALPSSGSRSRSLLLRRVDGKRNAEHVVWGASEHFISDAAQSRRGAVVCTSGFLPSADFMAVTFSPERACQLGERTRAVAGAYVRVYRWKELPCKYDVGCLVISLDL